MKKSLASLFACLILLFSATANAGQITAANVSGQLGNTVDIVVSLVDGDITFGGDFTVTFDSTRLSYKTIVGGAGFDPCCFVQDDPSFVSGSMFSLAQTAIDPALGPISPIFTIQFVINSPYPATVFPDSTNVDIAGFLYGANDTVEVRATSIVTVNAAPGGNVPEPGVLVLVGAALLIMGAVGHRNRVACVATRT